MGTRSLNSTAAAVLGAAFTLAGLLGFFVSDTFAGTDDDTLLGFEVNHLHNVVHVLIGLALLASFRRTETARRANLVIGATYVLLALLGPAIEGTDANVIALNGADHGLHLLSGVALVAVALLADKRARTGTRV